MTNLQTDYGTIRVTEDVVAFIAARIVEQCSGIIGMASKKATDGLIELLNRENVTKGVKVTTVDNSVVVGLFVIVEYGVSIHTIAQTAIDRVKTAIETFTGLTVSSVNITIEGINIK